jgi:hypothetical protein
MVDADCCRYQNCVTARTELQAIRHFEDGGAANPEGDGDRLGPFQQPCRNPAMAGMQVGELHSVAGEKTSFWRGIVILSSKGRPLRAASGATVSCIAQRATHGSSQSDAGIRSEVPAYQSPT